MPGKIKVHPSVFQKVEPMKDPEPVADGIKAQEAAIRSLIEKVNHLQQCIITIFESIDRHNTALELLAEDNPHLNLPRLTFAPTGNAVKQGIRDVGRSVQRILNVEDDCDD